MSCTVESVDAADRRSATREKATPDMPTIEALMNASLLEVFGERDADRRRAAIERTYHEDVEFLDPDEVITGRDALHAKVGRILDDAPAEFVFSPAGETSVIQDLAHLTWNLGPAGGPAAVRGFDVVIVRDGLIAKLYTKLLV